jgi:superfamily I DNA/RNA helicase
MYVAITRAKSTLYLVVRDEEYDFTSRRPLSLRESSFMEGLQRLPDHICKYVRM